jgi:uncharacterized damage-inducible protein DinB
METVLKPLDEILRLNTDLVLNCLEGLAEPDANARLTPNTNSISFLLAHMADARFFLAKLLGSPTPNPLEATLGAVTTIEEATSLPTLAELRMIWISVAEHLTRCFESVPAARLAERSEQAFPITDRSILGAVSFLLQHESYHLGQISLLRKSRGYDALSYTQRSGSDGGA